MKDDLIKKKNKKTERERMKDEGQMNHNYMGFIF